MSWLNRDGLAVYYSTRHYSTPTSAAPVAEKSAPLVLVHGLTCDETDWQAQVARFSPQRPVVSVDLRGHGRSLGYDPARGDSFEMSALGDDVAALLDALDVRDAVLAGHSMGCRVVLHAASRNPSRVAGLVLIDGSRFASGSDADARAAARAHVDKAGAKALALRLFTEMFTASSDAAVQRRIIERALRMPEPVLRALLEAMSGWDASSLEGVLQRLEQPILAIQSTYVNEQRERVVLRAGDSTPYIDLLAAIGRNATAAVIPDVGHFTMIDAPEETNQLMQTFMAQLPGNST